MGKAVEVKATGKRPTFQKKLIGVNIEEGQAIDIECEIDTADKNSTVEWTRNRKVVKASENVTMTFDGKVAHLHIEKATIEDAGEYMCVVKNQFGEADTQAKVDIKEKKEEKEEEEEQVEEEQEEKQVEKKRKESLKTEEKKVEKKRKESLKVEETVEGKTLEVKRKARLHIYT